MQINPDNSHSLNRNSLRVLATTKRIKALSNKTIQLFLPRVQLTILGIRMAAFLHLPVAHPEYHLLREISIQRICHLYNVAFSPVSRRCHQHKGHNVVCTQTRTGRDRRFHYSVTAIITGTLFLITKLIFIISDYGLWD